MTTRTINRQALDSGTIRYEGWQRDGERVTGLGDNYNVSDYFDRDGNYLGPDEFGVEPIFVDGDEWADVNTHRPVSNALRTAVDEFFGGAQVVYATPNTDNHCANFYGDTEICELTKHDVANLIQIAHSDWQTENDCVEGRLRSLSEAEAIEAVLADLQTARPDEN